ncbi:Mlf [Symbiodinium microadriaticum]|nr:Mlf [Symbiodinium microadriaticum]
MDSRAAETPERPRRSPSVVSVGTETTIAATLETSAKASECKPVATDAKASECKTAEPDVKITGIRLAEQASRALVPFPPKKPADGEENEESSGSLSSAYMHPSISSPATPRDTEAVWDPCISISRFDRSQNNGPEMQTWRRSQNDSPETQTRRDSTQSAELLGGCHSQVAERQRQLADAFMGPLDQTIFPGAQNNSPDMQTRRPDSTQSAELPTLEVAQMEVHSSQAWSAATLEFTPETDGGPIRDRLRSCSKNQRQLLWLLVRVIPDLFGEILPDIQHVKRELEPSRSTGAFAVRRPLQATAAAQASSYVKSQPVPESEEFYEDLVTQFLQPYVPEQVQLGEMLSWGGLLHALVEIAQGQPLAAGHPGCRLQLCSPWFCDGPEDAGVEPAGEGHFGPMADQAGQGNDANPGQTGFILVEVKEEDDADPEQSRRNRGLVLATQAGIDFSQKFPGAHRAKKAPYLKGHWDRSHQSRLGSLHGSQPQPLLDGQASDQDLNFADPSVTHQARPKFRSSAQR